MALPSSGLIDFSDVRAEMSQSARTNYALSGWVAGFNPGYSPVNLISSGSGGKPRYTVNAGYGAAMSMSQWYAYDHIAAISASTTESLYVHMPPFYYPYGCSVTSMIPVDVGTNAATLSLNISGGILYSDPGNYIKSCWMIFYGKPWQVDGSGTNTLSATCGNFVYSAGAELIASGTVSASATNRTIEYNYTYDANKGQYIYYVINRTDSGCGCDPSQC